MNTRRTVALCTAAVVALALAVGIASPRAARARADGSIEPKAAEALAAMSDLLAGAKGLRFTAAGIFERVTADGQKVQRATSIRVSLERGAGLRAFVARDEGQRMIWVQDGAATILDPALGQYVQKVAPGSNDALLGTVREWFGVAAPVIPFLASDPKKMLTGAVQTGRHLGRRTMDGTECDHLLFTQDSVDWQLWIDAEGDPVPRRLVITYKGLPGHPQYQAMLTGWSTAAELPKGGFEAPEGATKVDALPAWPGVGRDS